MQESRIVYQTSNVIVEQLQKHDKLACQMQRLNSHLLQQLPKENSNMLQQIQKGNNNIARQLQEEANNNIAIIVGNGYSFSVDENNNVTFTNHPKKIRGYRNCTIFAIYLNQTCEGMDVAERELADFINIKLKLYRKIILHGYADDGLRFLRLYHEQLDRWSKLKTHVVSVSASMKDTEFNCILAEKSEYNYYVYKYNIHIVVSKPSDNPLSSIFQLIRGHDMVPFEDQIPNFIYDQITASNSKSAMRKSCKFVRELM